MSRVYWRRPEQGPLATALDVMDGKGAVVMSPSLVVQGVALGGCIEAVGTGRRGSFRRKAHAHGDARDPYRGWICVLSDDPRRLLTPAGKPTRLLWHEWAHVFANTGHTDRFRRLLGGVGQPAAVMDRRA